MPIKPHKASEFLQTPEDIAAYLNAPSGRWTTRGCSMKAFRNIAEAQGGVSELSRRAKVDRVALSRALSGHRHPRLDTLAKVANACGVKLRFFA